MAPAGKDIGHVLAKPLGIKVDYRNEPGKDESALPDHVSLYFEEEPTAKDFLLQFKPTRAGCARYITSLFPFWNWIFHYNLQWLVGDVIAGLTVGFVVVPQGMAYALLAKLPPEYGLYTSFVGFLLYWAFATSKDITIGTVAVMSTIVGNIVIKVQDKHPDIPAEQVARGLSLLCGGILLFIGLIRAGWIVEFIPLVAITSFMTGAAISIAVGQVPAMMGISGINTRDATYLVIINTLKSLGKTKLDAALGLSALFALYFFRWICNTMSEKQPHRKKMWFFISTLRMAFIILLYTMISWLSNRGISNSKQAKFKILGTVPRGFQHAGAPQIDGRLIRSFSSELPAALIVLLIEHIAISKSFGRINNYTIDPSQELVALGFTNLFGPFLGGYPATGSFSRTAIKSKAGVRTPLAGIFTAVLVLLALYALTSVFFYIPMASLSGLIIHAVGDLITPPDVVYRFYQISPLEVVIFFAGVLVTVFTNIENGIYTAIAASAAVLLFRHARAKGLVLGRIRVHYLTDAELARYQQRQKAGSADEAASTSSRSPSYPPSEDAAAPSTQTASTTADTYIPVTHIDGSNPSVPLSPSPHPGVFVYKFTDGFTYANQASYLDALTTLVFAHTRPAQLNFYKRLGDRPWNDPGPRRGATVDLDSDPRPVLRAIVLDFSAVAHVDVTSVQGLVDVRTQLDQHAAPGVVDWHFAGVSRRWTKRALAAAGFGYAPSGSQAANSGLFGVAEVVGGGAAAEVRNEKKAVASDMEMGGRAEAGNWAGKKLTAVYGVNRPFFHVDVPAAVRAAIRSAQRQETVQTVHVDAGKSE